MTWKEFLDGRKFTAKERGVLMPGQRVGRVTLTGWYFRWVAQNLPETTFYQFLRMLEVPAIIVALVAFWIDYAERPIDRATRNAQLLAQVAQLATIEHANASGGIKAILELLAEEKVSMRGITLERTELGGVQLEGARLRSANLRRSSLTDANLSRTDLSGAKLTGADLSFANLEDANLTGADLTGADLTNARLFNAKLLFANLADAILAETILWQANLTGANLTGADLTGAVLFEANLTGANLARANLTNAGLTNANLTNAKDLTQEQLDSTCIMEGGKPPTLPEGLKPPQIVCEPWAVTP